MMRSIPFSPGSVRIAPQGGSPVEQRRSEHRVYSLLILGVLSVLLIALTVVVVCSGCAKKIATPDDPKAAAEMYLNALADSDWETAYYMVDRNTKYNFSEEQFKEKAGSIYGSDFKELFKQIEVIDSQVNGDNAVVTIRYRANGNTMEERLVREGGEWKMVSPEPSSKSSPAPTVNSALSTPEGTFNKMIEVLKTQNAQGFIELMSKEKKQIATPERMAQTFEKWREAGITPDMYDSLKLSRVENSGDVATVYFTLQGVEGTPYTFVKEDDGWKIDKW
jgi:hypothetical protein